TLFRSGGRRDAARARRGWPIAGAASILAGVLMSLVAVFPLHEIGAVLGAIAIILGCVMVAPWLVGAAGRAAAGLPVPLRLAVRDGARNRGRSAPVVAAIMAAVAAVTMVAIGGASDFRQQRLEYLPRIPHGTTMIRPPVDRADAVGAAVRRALPGVPVVPLNAFPGEDSVCQSADSTHCPSVSFAVKDDGGSRTIVLDNVVGGAREARLLLGRDDPAVTSALAQGKIVLFRSGPLARGTTTATVAVWDQGRRRTLRKISDLPAIGVRDDPHAWAIIPPSAAARVGLPVRTEAFGVDRADHRVTKAEEARLKETLAVFAQDPGAVYVERGFTGSFGGTLLALAAAAAVLALGGSLIGTRLAAADALPDLATLAAVGARPRTRRALMMGQAGFLAVLGCWLGIAAGLVPGIAVARPLTAAPDPEAGGGDHGMILVIPWELLLLVGVGVPLVAVLAAGALTRSRLPMAHRTAS
ncbi:ABC transporter permease, partial [Actinomadura roseirufa]|uniref:ABC transporter permease n=1 Tax=Actinomadura roseirufa TaxID=2094049 RepID=UPI0013F16804